MKRILVLATILGLLGVACAEERAGTLGPVGEGPTAEPTTEPSRTDAATPTGTPAPSADPETPSPEPPEETMTYEVWFAAGEGPWLFVTRRTEPFDRAIGSASLEALLDGPTDDEREVGVGSAIPEGTELLGLTIENGLATADLSSAFESGGGSTSMILRLAQLTYTLTQFGSVDAVTFTLDGEPIGGWFSSEGIIVDDPMTRKRFEDWLPPILVERPSIDDRVTSPITVAGTADVFEATVSISVVNADGDEIARTFTTATCGTGCRGVYTEAVRYRVDHTQPGMVLVYESSAKDGRPVNVVQIPITLVA